MVTDVQVLLLGFWAVGLKIVATVVETLKVRLISDQRGKYRGRENEVKFS